MGAFWRAGSWYWKFHFGGERYGPRGGFKSKRKALDAEWEERRKLGALKGQRDAAGVTLDAAIGRYVSEALATVATANRANHTLRLFRQWAGQDGLLGGISPADIEAYRTWRRARSHRLGKADAEGVRLPTQAGVQGTTINRDLADLSAFFTWCRRQKPPLYAADNPCLASSVPRDPDRWAGWIVPSPEQQRALWARLPTRERVKVILLKHLGVRRGIVLGLKKDQVDLPNRLLTYHSKGKTKVRPINETAARILRSLWPAKGDRVFPEKSITSLRREWDKARNAVGLPRMRLHDWRVTFARELASLHDVDLATIQDLLGHSTLTMTRRYVPESLRQMRRAVGRLDLGQKRRSPAMVGGASGMVRKKSSPSV